VARCRVLTNLGLGKYEIALYYQQEGLLLQKTILQSAISDMETELITLEAQRTVVSNQLDAIIADIDSQIISNPNAIPGLVSQRQNKSLELSRIRARIEAINSRLASSREKITQIDKVETRVVKDVWCADLSENITTDPNETGVFSAAVAIPGDDLEILLIPQHPGEKDQQGIAVQWDPEDHGDLVPALGQSSSQLFVNQALKPGWQKFRPTYRFAEITNVRTNGRLDISYLQPLLSREQALSIIPTTIKDDEFLRSSNVPVIYLDCDALAFANGDEVLVEFINQDASQPRVIGFRDHPKACGRPLEVVTPTGALTFAANTWTFEETEVVPQYGNTNWIHNDQRIVASWLGNVGRFPDDNSRGVNVYVGETVFTAPHDVTGACVKFSNC